MTPQEFWREVFATEEKIRRDMQGRIRRHREGAPTALGGQPESGQSVFIESLPSRINRHDGGAVCEVKFPLAAQRLVEGSHRLASPEGIARFREMQAENLHEVQAIELRNASRRVVSLRGEK